MKKKKRQSIYLIKKNGYKRWLQLLPIIITNFTKVIKDFLFTVTLENEFLTGCPTLCIYFTISHNQEHSLRYIITIKTEIKEQIVGTILVFNQQALFRFPQLFQ